QPLRFCDNGLDGAAALFAAHERDRTERAVPVAALGDLDVGGMCLAEPEPGGEFIIEIGWRADPEALGFPSGMQQSPADLGNAAEFPSPNHPVQFRQLFE